MLALSLASTAADTKCPPVANFSPTRMPMRWPLRYQILFPFAGLFLVVIVVISAVDAYLAVRAREAHTEQQLREVARTLLTSSFPLTDAVLRQTRGLSGTEFVVTSPDGIVVASSMEVTNLSAVDNPIDRWEQMRLGSREKIDSQTYFHSAIALTKRADRAEPGLLHVLYPERDWRAARWQAIYPPLVVGAISLVAVGGVAFAIAARLSKPIQSLQTQVGHLARGNFQAVSLPTHNDELRDLVQSVNQLAEQLDETRRVIKRTERLTLLGQLSGGLAHHLRNDVLGARMAIQLHQRDCSAEDAETLAVALRQLTLAEQHLQQFLAAGQPRPPQRQICNLREVVQDLVMLITPTCRHQRVDLQTEFSAGVEENFLADVDPEQLRQSLLNLVLNSLEAAGPEGWVRIECDASSGSVLRLRVIDSGPGVPPDIVERLFEPFTTTKPEGVGLGLTVSRQIAEAHGGSLTYHRNGATCFEILLPKTGGRSMVPATVDTRADFSHSLPA